MISHGTKSNHRLLQTTPTDVLYIKLIEAFAREALWTRARAKRAGTLDIKRKRLIKAMLTRTARELIWLLPDRVEGCFAQRSIPGLITHFTYGLVSCTLYMDLHSVRTGSGKKTTWSKAEASDFLKQRSSEAGCWWPCNFQKMPNFVSGGDALRG